MAIFSCIMFLFIATLILIGGIYTCVYDKAPIWERLHVLAIGFGMWIGVCYKFSLWSML